MSRASGHHQWAETQPGVSGKLALPVPASTKADRAFQAAAAQHGCSRKRLCQTTAIPRNPAGKHCDCPRNLPGLPDKLLRSGLRCFGTHGAQPGCDSAKREKKHCQSSHCQKIEGFQQKQLPRDWKLEKTQKITPHAAALPSAS